MCRPDAREPKGSRKNESRGPRGPMRPIELELRSRLEQLWSDVRAALEKAEKEVR